MRFCKSANPTFPSCELAGRCRSFNRIPGMPHRAHTPIVLEPEYIEGFRQIYEEKIVFNKTLGLKLTQVSPEGVVARIDMRPELVGHYAYNRVHGGVISAVLDAIGSAAVMAALAAKQIQTPITWQSHGHCPLKRPSFLPFWPKISNFVRATLRSFCQAK